MGMRHISVDLKYDDFRILLNTDDISVVEKRHVDEEICVRAGECLCDERITVITMKNGREIAVDDSINTIEARLEAT
jgi:hypothetical protein